MTLQEIIELVQQHHPEMGHNEIVLEANRAMDDILEIEQVAYDSSTSSGRTIPRLIYQPSEKDIG